MNAPLAIPLQAKDFKSDYKPVWCPGCGDYSVLAAITKALAMLELRPENVAVVSGIGCSSRIPAYTTCYGFHGVHGRALAAGTGLKVARPELTVLVAGGDGDGYSIGGNHFMHACRRNVDLTYIVMDNQIYGLTTGQVSPTSRKGMKTKSTPFGSVENPVNPIPMAIVCGATYVARGFSGQQKHLIELIKGAIEHRGFAFVDVFSPCVTYNKENTHEFFKQRTRKLEDMGHDPSDFHAAIEKGGLWGDDIPIGLFYRNEDAPSLDELEPVLAEGGSLAHQPLEVSPENARAVLAELMESAQEAQRERHGQGGHEDHAGRHRGGGLRVLPHPEKAGADRDRRPHHRARVAHVQRDDVQLQHEPERGNGHGGDGDFAIAAPREQEVRGARYRDQDEEQPHCHSRTSRSRR